MADASGPAASRPSTSATPGTPSTPAWANFHSQLRPGSVLITMETTASKLGFHSIYQQGDPGRGKAMGSGIGYLSSSSDQLRPCTVMNGVRRAAHQSGALTPKDLDKLMANDEKGQQAFEAWLAKKSGQLPSSKERAKAKEMQLFCERQKALGQECASRFNAWLHCKAQQQYDQHIQALSQVREQQLAKAKEKLREAQRWAKTQALEEGFSLRPSTTLPPLRWAKTQTKPRDNSRATKPRPPVTRRAQPQATPANAHADESKPPNDSLPGQQEASGYSADSFVASESSSSAQAQDCTTAQGTSTIDRQLPAADVETFEAATPVLVPISVPARDPSAQDLPGVSGAASEAAQHSPADHLTTDTHEEDTCLPGEAPLGEQSAVEAEAPAGDQPSVAELAAQQHSTEACHEQLPAATASAEHETSGEAMAEEPSRSPGLAGQGLGGDVPRAQQQTGGSDEEQVDVIEPSADTEQRYAVEERGSQQQPAAGSTQADEQRSVDCEAAQTCSEVGTDEQQLLPPAPADALPAVNAAAIEEQQPEEAAPEHEYSTQVADAEPSQPSMMPVEEEPVQACVPSSDDSVTGGAPADNPLSPALAEPQPAVVVAAAEGDAGGRLREQQPAEQSSGQADEASGMPTDEQPAAEGPAHEHMSIDTAPGNQSAAEVTLACEEHDSNEAVAGEHCVAEAHPEEEQSVQAEEDSADVAPGDAEPALGAVDDGEQPVQEASDAAPPAERPPTDEAADEQPGHAVLP